jgi:3-phenylpropionate/trans-cinnamate dioxygenase ferredoxin subunit
LRGDDAALATQHEPPTKRHAVCKVEELPPGSVRLVQVGRTSVGVFNIAGSYYALINRCPHRGAPLCLGSVGGTMLPSAPGDYRYGLDNLVLKCPWHRWEFDLRTGRSLRDPETERVRTYPVHVEDGTIQIEVGRRT